MKADGSYYIRWIIKLVTTEYFSLKSWRNYRTKFHSLLVELDIDIIRLINWVFEYAYAVIKQNKLGVLQKVVATDAWILG